MTGDPAEMSQAEFLYWESECEKRGLTGRNPPMAEPIREACARLAAWKSAKNTQERFDIYRDHPFGNRIGGLDNHALHLGHRSDLELVSDAYIATVPADSDEAVTRPRFNIREFVRKCIAVGAGNQTDEADRNSLQRLTLELEYALGINISIEPMVPNCKQCNDKGYYHEQSDVGQHYLKFDCSCGVPIDPKGGGN